ncbi:MAG: AAA family ATPase [Alphaproteobacteria bacterium]|nr:AAA family ATPase [Alphaproteobacteria bacterium]
MIEYLTLTDFRNHKTCRIETMGRKNVIITGPNGAGKTAILEAVSMLGGERGMRGAPMTDIARFNGNGGFSIFAGISDETELSVYFNAGDTNRHAKIDGDSAPLSNLARHLRIVWITPREDRIFVDNAADRRAFFDRLAASFDSAHAGRITRYTKLMNERAGALKNGADGNWIDALDIQIAAVSVAIAATRIQYAGEINYFLKDIAVSVDGMVESMILTTNAASAERDYLSYLKSNRALVNDKMVLDGVNKSDFGIFNMALNLPANLTSTGQQKTTILKLILAHAKLVYTKTGAHPIILLDEAIAHLDQESKEKLFSELGDANAQVWATGIDAGAFTNVPDAIFVSCTDGIINNIIHRC